MSRGRLQPQRPLGKQLRVNDQIRTSPVRLIDENDRQVGIVDLAEAKRRAREAGLDLVEVAPTAQPPVCKIMDYGKWKYQQKKKEQKARSHAKVSELKEIRVRPKIDEHDLEIKLSRAREFLTDGNKVQFTLLFRGREMAHRELGLQVLEQVRQRLADLSKVENPPRLLGRRMTMVLAPDRRARSAASASSSTTTAPPPPQPPVSPSTAPAAVQSSAASSSTSQSPT